MTLLNLRVESFRFPIADSLDEVGEVVSVSCGSGARLFLAAQKRPIGTVVGDFDISLRPEEENANRIGITFVQPDVGFRIGDPMSDFKGKKLLLSREFKRTDLSVGSLLVVIKHIMSAHGLDFGRKPYTQSPAGYIELVHSLIPDVSTSIG